MFAKLFERRILLLKIVVCLSFVIGILLSFSVWHSDRLFPLLPLIEGIPPLSGDISSFLAIVLIVGLLLGCFIRHRNYFIVLLIFLCFLLLQDQMRWQPWVYIYTAILLPFALWKKPSEQLLPYFQFLLIGVYFWSGFYKFGSEFIEATFDKMLKTLFFIEDANTRESLHFLGYGIPTMEIAIAFGLMYRKTRNVAVLLAVLTHIVILSYLIIIQQNTVVYPWNIAMILLVIFGFYTTSNSLRFWENPSVRLKLLHAGGALFFMLLPAFNPLGIWDKYLSFKLYTGTSGIYCIGLDKDQYRKVDSDLYAYFWNVDEPQGKYWLCLNYWAIDELNVPFYPEMRTFKRIANMYCDGAIPEEKLEFVVFRNGFSREGATVLKCDDCE